MRSLSTGAMSEVQGGAWYHAFACGVMIVADIAAIVSPDPVSKFAIAGLWAGTVAACGATFAD